MGKKGQGKTHWIQSRLKQIPKPLFILDSLDEYNEGIIFGDGYKLINYILDHKENCSGIYILRPMRDLDVEYFFRLVFYLKNCSVIVEEASIYCSPYGINPNFKKILNYGRHRNINLIAVARRSSELHRDITAQSDFIVSFKQSEHLDLKLLATVDERADQLNSLKEYEYLVLGDIIKSNFLLDS